MSSRPVYIPLVIHHGITFSKVFRWGQPKLAYRKIQAASQTAPCVLTTDTPHDLPDGWSFRVSGCKGMVELNDRDASERISRRYFKAKVVSPTTIELNDVNAAGFRPYTGGGIITYNVPVDLAGLTAKAQVRSDADSPSVLLEFSTSNGRIVLNNVAKTITMQLSAADAAILDWTDGFYNLEPISPGGIVTSIAAGPVRVDLDTTRQ